MRHMNLTVEQIPEKDIWRDFVRIPHSHRKDQEGKGIPRGTVCSLRVNDKKRLVAVRGCPNAGARIQIDDVLRHKLGLTEGQTYNIELRRVTWFGYWRWSATASDPAYRVPAQISLVSFVLGVIGLLLGVLPLLHCGSSTSPQATTRAGIDSRSLEQAGVRILGGATAVAGNFFIKPDATQNRQTALSRSNF